jgi:hypothetical protein
MKKLFTLLSFVFVITFANAQRKCDLLITQYIPGPGWEIQNGRPFDITVKVKNIGPDAIKVTDTILYLLKLDASYIMSGGSPIGKAFFGLAIAPGAEVTQYLFTGLTLTFTTIDGTHQFCTETTLFNRSTSDGATDLNTANNTGCAAVLMNKFPSGINSPGSITLNGLSVSPNPTMGNTIIAYSLSDNNNVKITVRDLSGREVMSVVNEKMGAGSYEKSIDMSSLNAGVYFVEYTAGDKVYTSKLIKQ